MDRRKGGAKSASSGRAAEMLRAQGFQVGFVGFGNATNIFQQGPADNKPSVEIDPEIRAAFGKLTKKDRRTREGALDALTKILQVKSEEELKGSFAYFAGNYSTFVTDCSAAFRAEANNVLRTYIKRLKKEIQEELREILPFVLFSTYDAQNMVSKAAGAIFNDCFDEDKRARIKAAFAPDTVNIVMQIINRSHKLILPQKFADEESDEERVSRLTAQSLAALHDLGEKADAALLEELTTNSSTMSRLLSLPENVRSSLFLLFTRLLKADIEPFFGTKVPSTVLSSLDNKNVTLSRNAFECFLLFADNDRFYDVCKIEKAVIPKFVSMVRKKDRHWMVLETYLLPSFALIYKHLPADEQKSKFMTSIAESFFDGNVLENAFPVKSWAKAFSELVQFCFLNSSSEGDLDFLATKIFSFLSTVIDSSDSESLEAASSLVVWLYKKDLATTDFRNTLELNMMNKLPSSSALLERFLPELRNHDRMMQERFLSSPAIPSSLMLKLLPLSPKKHEVLSPKKFAYRIEREENADVRLQLLSELVEFLNAAPADTEETLDTLLDLNHISTACEVVATLGQKEEHWNDRILKASLRVKHLSQVAEHLLFLKEPSSLWTHWRAVVKALGRLETADLDRLLEQWIPLLQPAHVGRLADLLKEDGELKNISADVRETAQLKLISLTLQHPSGTDGLRTEVIDKASTVIANLSQKPNTSQLRELFDELVGSDTTSEGANFAAKLAFKCGLQEALFTNRECFERFCERIDVYAEHFVVEGLEILPLMTHSQRRDEKLDVREYLRRAYFYGQALQYSSGGPDDYTFAIVIISAALGEFLLQNNLIPVEWDEEVGRTVLSLRGFIAQKGAEWKKDFVMSIRPLPSHCCYYQAARYLTGPAFEETIVDMNAVLLEAQKQYDARYLALLIALKESVPYRDISSCTGLSQEEKAAWAAEFLAMREKYPKNAVESVEVEDGQRLGSFGEGNLRQLVDAQGFDSFLFSYVNETSADAVPQNILSCAYARLLTRLHKKYLKNVLCPDSQNFMDAGLVTMFDVLSNADKDTDSHWTFDVYATFASRLYRRYIESYTSTALNEKPTEHIKSCREAWKDFIFPICNPAYLTFFLHNSGVQQGDATSYLALELSRTVCSMKMSEFAPKEMSLPKRVDPALDQLRYSEELQNILVPVLDIINNARLAPVPVQLAAVHILKGLIHDMFEHENRENYEREKEGKCTTGKFKLPYVLEQALKTITVSYDQYLNIPPAILVWDALMDYALLLDVSEKFTFNKSLESDSNRLQTELVAILTTIYTKLPDSPEALEKTIKSKSDALEDSSTGILFTQKPSLENFHQGHYYSNLFYRTLTAIPAHVRDWAKSLNKTHFAIVSKFIQQNISPLLIRHELQNMKVAAASEKKENLQIRIMPAISQITAEYKFEDSSMVLNIVIPPEYPLSLPNVNYEKKMLEVQKQRKWLLQLVAFLNHQNGSMWDGVNQWRRSIEDHMEGVEECLICFSTVSADNFQLPKIQCKPCKKKFHGSCLYKWFESKDVPTCPHCRASFL